MKSLLLISVLLWPIHGVGEIEADVAFIGALQELVLVPRGRNGCPEPVSENGGILVTNFCGCGTARFEMLESVRPLAGESYEVQFRVGEWCEPNISIFQESKFLVYRAAERPYRWIEAAVTENGELGFYSNQLDLLFYDLEISVSDIRFGPQEIELCEELEGKVSCELVPAILAKDLIDFLHRSNGSSRAARTRVD